MELANQIFYLVIALVSLGLLFPAYVNLDSSRGYNNDTHYWFYAIAAQFLSAVAFAAFQWMGSTALAIGAMSQYAVSVFLTLLFISFNKRVHKNLILILGLSIVGFFALRELDYVQRVLASMSCLVALGLWQLYELDKLNKKDRSIYVGFLLLAIVIQIGLALLRMEHAWTYLVDNDGGLIPINRYEEPEHEFLIRLGIVVLYLLIIIGVGNYHFHHLWEMSQRKIKEREQQMLDALNALANARDNETGQHTLRAQGFVKLLANELRANSPYRGVLTDAFVDSLFKAAPLHDIGKVGIPDHILLKPGKHTPEEFEVMKTHATLGERILSASDETNSNEIIKMATVIAVTHHERWDGTGYPMGLRGEMIPLAGRIMAVADVYDALTAKRKYKRSWSHDDAFDEIVKNKGIHFDAVIVEAFERVGEDFRKVAESFDDAYI